MSFHLVPGRGVRENSTKLAKKLKHIFIASFEVKMGWEQPRKREKKTIVSINSYLIRDRKFKKLKNIVTASFQAKMGRERLRKKEKKIIVLTNSYPTRNRKLIKK